MHPFGVAAYIRALATTTEESPTGSGGSDSSDAIAADGSVRARVSPEHLVPNPGRRAANPECAGIPRICHACGETFPSGNILFCDHLNADPDRECPYTPAPPPDFPGAISGPCTAGSGDGFDPSPGRPAATPGRAGNPRTCHACGGTSSSGYALFRDHLNADRECPYAPAPPPGSSGAISGPRAEGSGDGTAHADAFLANAGGSGVDDGAAVSSRGVAGIGASSASAQAPDLPIILAGLLARVLASDSASVSEPDLPGLLATSTSRANAKALALPTPQGEETPRNLPTPGMLEPGRTCAAPRPTSAGGAYSGSATDPHGPSGNVDANVSRATTDEHAGGDLGEHQDTVSGEVPARRSPGPDDPGRHPPGYGEEPLPDYQGRASWHLISTHGEQMRPKAREVWWFLVDSTPGSMETANKRWAQVLIPPGQELRPFAARPELRISGAVPMTYVDDPSPVTASCWYDEDENGPGYYSRVYSLPRLVLDAWGRSPAQGAAVTAAAEARAKVDLDMLTHWPRHDRSLLQSSRPRYPSPYGVAA